MPADLWHKMDFEPNQPPSNQNENLHSTAWPTWTKSDNPPSFLQDWLTKVMAVAVFTKVRMQGNSRAYFRVQESVWSCFPFSTRMKNVAIQVFFLMSSHTGTVGDFSSTKPCSNSFFLILIKESTILWGSLFAVRQISTELSSPEASVSHHLTPQSWTAWGHYRRHFSSWHQGLPSTF